MCIIDICHTYTHTQMYIKLASTDTKNRVFLHVMWQIIWQNLKLMLQYPWAKWVLPVNLRPIAEISSAPSIGASMSDINQCRRVFYHKPGSNGKELNKEIQRPKKQTRQKSFEDSVGLQNTSPPTLRSNINNHLKISKAEISNTNLWLLTKPL